MEVKETLRAITDDARGWLRSWAEDFTEAEALEPPPGGRTPNPLAWQLGHLACVEEDVGHLFCGGEPPPPLVPSWLRAACSPGSPPPTSETRYLPLAELWTLLERTHERLLAVLDTAGPEDLDCPPRMENRFFQSLRQGVYDAALHETYHVGEIAALRKALGKPRIM